MQTRIYVSPLLPDHGGVRAHCPGMALRFRRGHADAPLAAIHADHGLLETRPNPVFSDMLGDFPQIFLRNDADYHVELLNAAGTVVASHALAADSHGAAIPDDAGVFTDFAHLSLPATVRHLRSEGWDVSGKGAADYIADALATPELARAHPRFCVMMRNGRCFRLQPAGGLITVEQGGAKGDTGSTGHIDDRAAIQAAIDYAAATGIERIGFTAEGYAVWTPTRTSPVNDPDAGGNALVLAVDQKLHLVGLGRQRSRLRFLAPNGASPDGTVAGSAYHLVGGEVWRGSGFYLRSTAKVDWRQGNAIATRQTLTLEHLVIDGCTRKSGYYSWPARPSDGAGWDVTHKGIRCQADTRGADLKILDCEMVGWRGETVYTSSDPSSRLTVRNSSFSHSNGQGLNPNGCMVDVDNCRINDCYIGIEGWTGVGGGRMTRVEIVDCFGLPDRSGGAFSIDGQYFDFRRMQAGASGPRLPAQYGQRGTFSASPVTIGQIDLTVVNCGRSYIGSWLTGSIKAVDTTLVIGDGTALPGGARGLDLDIELVTDRTERGYLVVACRQSGLPTDDIKVRLKSSATSAAIAADRRPQRAITWHGLMGPNITVEFSGRDGRQAPQADAPATGAPRLIHR